MTEGQRKEEWRATEGNPSVFLLWLKHQIQVAHRLMIDHDHTKVIVNSSQIHIVSLSPTDCSSQYQKWLRAIEEEYQHLFDQHIVSGKHGRRDVDHEKEKNRRKRRESSDIFKIFKGQSNLHGCLPEFLMIECNPTSLQKFPGWTEKQSEEQSMDAWVQERETEGWKLWSHQKNQWKER